MVHTFSALGGKTTVAGWLLSTIPDRKRIFTIEDGSRELQLIRAVSRVLSQESRNITSASVRERDHS